LLIATLLLSACSPAGTLSVGDAWARPAQAGDNSAAYFIIQNPTGQEDLLLGASSAVAEHVEIHRSAMSADNTMSMHPQENVPVPANGQVAFEPGGLHVMLIQLTDDLEEGATFPLRLQFQSAGEIILEVNVEQR
jgi:copper(I)-binding protein